MTSNDIGTKHFLKRLMDAYDSEVKAKRANRSITIEEAATILQEYLNNTPDPLQDQIDPITGATVHIDYLDGKYYIKINNDYLLDCNKPVYKLTYNDASYALGYSDNFEIDWSPKDDTLESFVYVNVHEDSVFNQNPVMLLSKSEWKELNISGTESFYQIYEKVMEYERKRQRFFNIRWYREYDNTYVEDRVNPDRVFFSYKGVYKMTFLKNDFNVKDMQFYFNNEMKYDFDIRVHNTKIPTAS